MKGISDINKLHGLASTRDLFGGASGGTGITRRNHGGELLSESESCSWTSTWRKGRHDRQVRKLSNVTLYLALVVQCGVTPQTPDLPTKKKLTKAQHVLIPVSTKTRMILVLSSSLAFALRSTK